MSQPTTHPRAQARRDQARQEILDAAWGLAAAHGLAGLSLREIAGAVGMQAPSLYSYFPSKSAILDAMFAGGYRALDEELARQLAALPPSLPLAARLSTVLQRWLRFCQDDVARYQLMFTACVPGWHPSPDAYAASEASYRQMSEHLAEMGISGQENLDVFTAITAGLAAQQMANDPTGDRWRRRTDDVVAMFLQHVGVGGSLEEDA